MNFDFVSGETGIGKSTLGDSLFNTTFDSAPETHKVILASDWSILLILASDWSILSRSPG